MSAPSSSGRWQMGVAQVLSTTTIAPGCRAMATISSMSVIVSSGLDGVSTQMTRVPSRTAPRTAARSLMSTDVARRPQGTNISFTSLGVPELTVDVALERGGQVDRRGNAAGHGIGSGAGVDAEGFYAHGGDGMWDV